MTPLQNFLNTIGVLAEACMAYYSAFLKAGFTSDQALTLTGKMLECLTMLSKGSDNEE